MHIKIKPELIIKTNLFIEIRVPIAHTNLLLLQLIKEVVLFALEFDGS